LIRSARWSVTLVVAVKYLGFITRADSAGEAGISALLALLPKQHREGGPGRARAPRGADPFRRSAAVWRRREHAAISVLSAFEAQRGSRAQGRPESSAFA
jgi:KUP system potassium uptake protein